MNFNAGTAKACGFFKLSKGKVDPTTGEEILLEETPMFQNLVLDSGINVMNSTTGFHIREVYLGTGNSEPNVSQTQLDNKVAGVTIGNSGPNTPASVKIINDDYWCIECKDKVRFGDGTFNNVTLAEIGLGIYKDGYTYLWNRTLIKDEEGQPTTITVLKDEYLDVSFVYRFYFPRNPIVTSVNIRDKNNDIIKQITATIFFNAGNSNGQLTTRFYQNLMGPASSCYNILKIKTTIPEKAPFIYFTDENLRNMSRPYNVYNYYSPKCTFNNGEIKATITVGYGDQDFDNFEQHAIGFYSGNAGAGIVVYFSEPVIKKSTETMSYSITYKWGRYEPTPEEVPTVES